VGRQKFKVDLIPPALLIARYFKQEQAALESLEADAAALAQELEEMAEFASWISVEFRLYLIKEFQRLKEDENRRLSLAWNLNRTLDGNMREYASVEQLLVLANIEGMNAEFIHMGLPQGERLKRLNQIAIRQMQVLTTASAFRALGEPAGGKQ
jgi:hypothetical protein